MKAAERRAAAALMRHGTYHENPDGLAWLQSDVDDVLCAAEHTGRDELVALLANAAWWDPSSEGPERAHAVADEMGLP